MHHPTDRITHTTAFITPVVEHWLEREIAQWAWWRMNLEKLYRPLIKCHLTCMTSDEGAVSWVRTVDRSVVRVWTIDSRLAIKPSQTQSWHISGTIHKAVVSPIAVCAVLDLVQVGPFTVRSFRARLPVHSSSFRAVESCRAVEVARFGVTSCYILRHTIKPWWNIKGKDICFSSTIKPWWNIKGKDICFSAHNKTLMEYKGERYLLLSTQ